jgi:hypothetical protein
MRHRKEKRAERLRLIVDTLPYETRLAMLEGIEQYDIIVGAYSDKSGGVCPMLAAHRCGGRTDLRSFARAWDRFTGAGKRARRANERELRTLAAQLESSIWREDQARYAHAAESERLARSAPSLEIAPAEPAKPRRRAQNLGAWLIPFRNLEDYARALRSAMSDIEDLGQSSGGDAPREQREREPEFVA